MEVRETVDLGRTAFATRDFQLGEVVLEEEPMLMWSDGSDLANNVATAVPPITTSAKAHGHAVSYASPEIVAACNKNGFAVSIYNNLYAFVNANDEVRRKYLELFCVPLDSDYPKLPDFKKAAAVIMRNQQKEFKPLFQAASLAKCKLDEPLIIKIILIASLNTHSFLGRNFAVFELASKIAHSCAPNMV
eukprot:GEZU01033525.1.p1 GENE.GEZU01033525.1~~GEZU01033525.1.p1  ORF type:complete len:190 (+),score=41.14 GEZU01033525.1:159-728(+)